MMCKIFLTEALPASDEWVPEMHEFWLPSVELALGVSEGLLVALQIALCASWIRSRKLPSLRLQAFLEHVPPHELTGGVQPN
jgi:hypothetical protein